MALVEIKNLTFAYPGSEKNALCGVDLSAEAGELVVVCGTSGGGKSTLLRLLKKEIAPYGKLSGRIEAENCEIGFVGQNVESNIVTDTVLGELAFALECRDFTDKEISLKIAQAASYFNLNKYINEKTDSLSGGVKQLLALACAASVNPRLLLLDEPCSQLDPISAQNFKNTVLRLNRELGVTVVASEHSPQLLPHADKILFLENGKAQFCGCPEEFAHYLLENEMPFSLILPPYTRLLKSRTLDFAAARREIADVQARPCEDIQKHAAAVTVKNLAFAYGRKQPDILFGMDYTAEQGRINAIVGANGCGKTTFLKCLAGILRPYGGKIKKNGKTAYLPQNVQTLFLYDSVNKEVNSKALLSRYGLDAFRQRNPFDLSGGEAQRLALAKIEQTGADILLLDEPTKGTDPVFRAKLAGILKAWCAAGKTIILSTHDLEFAGRYADNVAFLFGGNIVCTERRRKFFAALDIYTTSLSALTNGRIVSIDDAEVSP